MIRRGYVIDPKPGDIANELGDIAGHPTQNQAVLIQTGIVWTSKEQAVLAERWGWVTIPGESPEGHVRIGRGGSFAKIFAVEQPADPDPWAMIEALRADEGSSVTILADNADFDGPGAAVEVCGDWNNWNGARFTGETVVLALQSALEAYRASKAPVEETV